MSTGPTVMTVLGPVAANELGVTLMHEHLVSNAVAQWSPPEDPARLAEFVAEYEPAMHGRVQLDPFSYRSAMQQLSLDVALTELRRFRAAGGGTVVDLGVPGFGRDHVALQVLSRLSGVHIVMGCGEYVEHSHSPYVRHAPAETVRDVVLGEFHDGVGTTGIRAGVIGEIGTGNPATAEELKVLTGAALAAMETGAALNIHRSIQPDPLAGLAGLDHVLGLGLDPSRVVVSHCDERPEHAFALEVARRGAWVELDTFGMEQWAVSARRGDGFPRRSFDHDRIGMLLALLEAGHEERILLSHDIAMKPQFTAYGGWGLTHLLENVRPRAIAAGVPADTWDRLLTDNPRRALTGR
ncbi:hypothetical protein [Streptomyces sp. NPDC047000]|uniref:phosphotriesterase family protein n=1 Tax=Streptomyces sp. NPDC047000 TaxID=3155474 RepID=UPI0033E162B2